MVRDWCQSFGFGLRGELPDSCRGDHWLDADLGAADLGARDNEHAPERPLVFVLELTAEDRERRRTAMPAEGPFSPLASPPRRLPGRRRDGQADVLQFHECGCARPAALSLISSPADFESTSPPAGPPRPAMRGQESLLRLGRRAAGALLGGEMRVCLARTASASQPALSGSWDGPARWSGDLESRSLPGLASPARSGRKPLADPLRRAGEMLAAGELRPGG
jgi:hypothetical protein